MSVIDSIKQKFVGAVPSLHHAHPRYRWWVLFNVMIGTFMAVLDSTIVDVALTKIMGSFGADIDKVEWVITAYMLVFAVMLPTSGWVADHFGHKRTYFMGLMFFTLGSFLCGFAWDENALIMFRVVQGAGAGLMMPVGMAIVTREFPVEKRGIALGFWTIAAAASVSLGPLVGGYLVDNIGWNAIFDINVPVGMVAMFATLVIQREYRMEQSRSFDIVGFLSGSIFVSALLLALADGNATWNTGGWSSLFIITCFFISAVALIVFLVTEFTTEHPLIDLKLLKNFNFGVANAVMFIFGMGMFGSTFLLPLYLQNALSYTALQAGAVFLPVGIVQALMSPTAGFISDKINPKIPAVIGLAMLGVGLLLNSSLSLFSESDYIMIPLLLRGFGMGLLFTPLATLALAEIPRHKMAQASGLFNIIRQIGGSFGVAIMGTLLTRRMMYHTATYSQAIDQGSPVYKQITYGLSRFAQSFDGSPISTAMIQAKALIISHIAQQAFVKAVCDDFFVAAIVTFIGVIPIMFLRAHKKPKGEHIAAME